MGQYLARAGHRPIDRRYPMLKPTPKLIAPGIAALALSACLDAVEPTQANFALLDLHADQAGSEFTVSPVAIFFRARGVGLPSSDRTTNVCQEIEFPDTPGQLTLTYLDAGPNVTATFASGTATLVPMVAGGDETYELPFGATVVIDPGETVEFSVPVGTTELGPLTVEAGTAEDFVPGEITISQASDDPVELTWTPPDALGSAMAFEFRFDAGATGEVNRELLCFFIDDGEAQIPAAQLENFVESAIQEVKATRQRITTIRGANTVAHITSTIEFPVTVHVLTP
jgi:hypothetical protein